MKLHIRAGTQAAFAATFILGFAQGAWAVGPNAAEHAEIVAVQAAAISPAAAIGVAESHAGGRALSFGYEKNASTSCYEVKVSTPSGLSLVQVDPASGQVLRATPQPANAIAEDGLSASAVPTAAKARIPLSRAVAIAEQQAQGRALEASYLASNGQIRVSVEVVGNGRLNEVMVDPATGQASQAASQAGAGSTTIGAHEQQGDQDSESD